ncbi:MAG: hypothetical protein JSV78_04730, partial [Phycisphaerales bacterium]
RRFEILTILSFAALPFATVSCRGIVDPAAETAFLKSLGETSITVFPAYVRGEQGTDAVYDADAAQAIAGFIDEEGLATVTVSDGEVPIAGPWHMNQAQMLAESAASFGGYLQDNPAESDYALLAEYLIGPRAVMGIHCYVIDGDGRIAYVVLLNSHHSPFSEADPQTVEDCTEVLLSVLREDLVQQADDG